MRRFIILLVSVQCALFTEAFAQWQITFEALTQPSPGGNVTPVLYRIRPQDSAGALLLENLTAALEAKPFLNDAPVLGPVAVSTDGAYLAFRSRRFAPNPDEGDVLTLMTSDLNDIQAIQAENLAGVLFPVSPDGKFAVGPNGSFVIFSARSDDWGGPHLNDLYLTRRMLSGWTKPLLLSAASPFPYQFEPSLSQDGQSVFFAAGTDPYQYSAICQVGTNAAAFQILVSTNGIPANFTASQIHSPAQEQSGSIVFEGENGPGVAGERIWRFNPATGGLAVVINVPNDNSPVLLPDGRILSLEIPDGFNKHNLKLMDADGQNGFLLASEAQPQFAPVFQFDSDVSDIGIGAGPGPIVRPKLEIARDNGKWLLRWPQAFSCRLEETSQFPAAWSTGGLPDVPLPTLTPLGQYQIRLDRTDPLRFFRLELK